MEKKNNMTQGSVQPVAHLKQPRDALPSDALKEALLSLDLMAQDFEKLGNHLEQVERFVSAPLEFDLLQRRVKQLVDKLAVVTDRTLENHQYLQSELQGVYKKLIELEGAIWESRESINKRFVFSLHQFDTGEPSREVSGFSEFLSELTEKHERCLYFVIPFGPIPLLICRDMSSITTTPLETVTQSASVALPTGVFRFLKRAWHRLFCQPNQIVLHLFQRSQRQRIGTFKYRTSVPLHPYFPYRYDDSAQTAKISYDFINFYGVSGKTHAHLLKGHDTSAIVMTKQPVQFDGRLLRFAEADCPEMTRKFTRPQLIIV